MAIIYLPEQLLVRVNLPTLYLGRAALRWYYTWHFSMQGLPVITIASVYRELLPHVFTLTCPKASAVIFCGTFCSFPKERPGSSPVHCYMLSGLSSPYEYDAIAWLVAKGKNTLFC